MKSRTSGLSTVVSTASSTEATAFAAAFWSCPGRASTSVELRIQIHCPSLISKLPFHQSRWRSSCSAPIITIEESVNFAGETSFDWHETALNSPLQPTILQLELMTPRIIDSQTSGVEGGGKGKDVPVQREPRLLRRLSVAPTEPPNT